MYIYNLMLNNRHCRITTANAKKTNLDEAPQQLKINHAFFLFMMYWI